MGEINTANSGQKPGVRRGKKLSTRIDLTPMVDLGFLLITFFIFTTTMSMPQALDLYMPVDEPDDSTKYPESKVLTVIPVANDKIFYYHGKLSDAVEKNQLGICGYDLKTGIGSIIRTKQKVLDQRGIGKKELTLIIRPAYSSTYRNTTDLLDEVLINELKYYSLADLQKEEIELLKKKGLEY